MQFDPEAFGEAMADYVREAIAPLLKRIDDLEARDVNEQVRAAIAAIPKAADGAPGKDAPPVDVDAIVKRVVDLVPKPADGLPGKDAPSVDVDAIAKRVADLVPKPVDGEPGKDGAGVAGAMIDRDGALQLTLSNGEVKNLGTVVGKDGVSFDAFDLEYLPESHEISVKATAAGRVKEIRYPAGGIRPRGYWRDGTKAAAGEAWVHDGSLWIATKDTATKPETKGAEWVIAARKGRDGETTVRTIGPTVPIKLQA